jgi:hypothetical protein
MTNKYVGAAQFVKNLITGGKKSGDGKAIKSFKPGTKFKGTPTYQKDIIKARSEVQKKFQPINEGIANQTKQLRQTLQKVRGEKVTSSGISKGKDVGPGIYEPKKKIEKKAKGGRIGLKGGSFPDLSGDGKTTMEDILIGRGVIPKPKNKKKMVAKKTKTPMEKAIKKNKNKKKII